MIFPDDLSKFYGVVSEILEINGNIRFILFEKKVVEYYYVYVAPDIYCIASSFKLKQKDKFIPLLDLFNEDKIYNIFDKKKDFKVLSKNTGYFGMPEDLSLWIDKKMVVSK